MRSYKIVLGEFLLILASVLIFRSIWMLLDRIPVMNLEFGIWASLIMGVAIALVSLVMLNGYVNTKTGKEDSA